MKQLHGRFFLKSLLCTPFATKCNFKKAKQLFCLLFIEVLNTLKNNNNTKKKKKIPIYIFKFLVKFYHVQMYIFKKNNFWHLGVNVRSYFISKCFFQAVDSLYCC